MDTFSFHRFLESSKMLHCNKTLALSLREEFRLFYNGTRKLTDEDFEHFVELRDVFYSLRMIPMLTSGSLLGT